MRCAALVLILLALAPASIPAQAPVKETVTPGSVVLLAVSPELSGAPLREAMTHADPLVRAAGARVAAAVGATGLAEFITGALTGESDERAAAEMIRALLLLRGAPARDDAEAQARKLGGAALLTYHEWLSRHEPRQFAEIIERESALLQKGAAVRFGGFVALAASQLQQPGIAQRYIDAVAARGWGAVYSGSAAIDRTPISTRTAPIWLPGLFTSLSDAAKCKLTDEPRFGYARMTYAGDGRPLDIGVDASALSKECASVLRALARTALFDSDRPTVAGQQQWVVVPFSRPFSACTDAPGWGLTPFSASAGFALNKIKDVPPVYPADMLAAGKEGLVVAQAVIAAEGCVASVRVLRTAGASLDLAAIRAITGWRFAPLRVDAAPTDGLATLTVNFGTR